MRPAEHALVDIPVADPPPSAVDPSAVGPITGPAATDPARMLALDAVSVIRRLGHARRPRRWSAPAFRHEVDLIRSHLIPLRDRSCLAHSFAREAFHTVPGEVRAVDDSAVRVAYAIRWLELGDGRSIQSWSQLLDARAVLALRTPLPA
jgi:hypothetical protein